MRCFIHVVTGERFLRDEDGADFPNLRAAAAEAAQSARDLMAEELRNGNVLPVSWKVLLSSPDDTVLMSLPFSQFVPAPEPLPHRARVAHRDYEGIERRHLGEADRHIMHGRARVGAQRERISRMEELGVDTSVAEDFLALLETTLNKLVSHRELILKSLP